MHGPSVSVAQDTDHLPRSQINFTQLSTGWRIEDFLVEDDESSTSSTSTAPSLVSEEDQPSLRSHASEELLPRSRPASIRSDFLNELPGNPWSASSSSSEASSALSDHFSRSASFTGQLRISPALQPAHMSLTPEKAAEKEVSMLTMLRSLRDPQMSVEYFEKLHLCFWDILQIWNDAPLLEHIRQRGILARLQRGIYRAQVLRSMCDLESQNPVFSERLAYRDSLLEALGIENSSFQKELQSLGATVLDAMTLFSSVVDTGTTTVVDRARKVFRDQRHALRSTKKEEVQSSKAIPEVTRKSVVPFLTWTWLSSEPGQGDEAERVAAEILSGTMKDIERSLVYRNETSYKYARELTLSDLEATRSKQRSQPPGVVKDSTTPTSTPKTPVRTASQAIIAQLSSPLRHSIGDLSAEDAILRMQNNSMNAALDQLFGSAKRFVELYIPSSYKHPVCHKVWGSLASLMTVCIVSQRLVVTGARKLYGHQK
jgi:hypothetical protein